MNEDNILICFHCGEIRDMPSEEAVERFGDMILECCDHRMYQFESNKLYLLVKNMETVKEKLEQQIVEEFGVESSPN